MKESTKTIIEEVTVLFASVFVFRSTWTLLDRLPGMSDDLALWVMLAIGTTILAVSLSLLNKKPASPS